MLHASFFHLRQSLHRHFAHMVFWLLIALALSLFFGPINLSHDDELFLGIMCIVSALSLLFPWVLTKLFGFWAKGLDEKHLGKIEFFGAIMMILTWIGSLGLFRAGLGYDTAIHFINSLLITWIFIILLRPMVPRKMGLRIIIACLLIVLVAFSGLIVELFEWGFDQLIGTGMYGELGEPNDTLKDAMANTLGLITGLTWAARTKSLF